MFSSKLVKLALWSSSQVAFFSLSSSKGSPPGSFSDGSPSSCAATPEPSSSCRCCCCNMFRLLLFTNTVTAIEKMTTKTSPHPKTHLKFDVKRQGVNFKISNGINTYMGGPAIFLPWHSDGTFMKSESIRVENISWFISEIAISCFAV